MIVGANYASDIEAVFSKYIRSTGSFRYFKASLGSGRLGSHLFSERQEMLNNAIIIPGEHPDVIVDGKHAEIVPSFYSTFWTSYCEAIESENEIDVQQVSLEAQTLIVRCNVVPTTEKMDSIVRNIQTYLRTALVFDRLSDNDLRCIVTSGETSTSFYFPCCRLVAKEIENVYMPTIANLLREKQGLNVVRFDALAPTRLYGSSSERYVIAFDDVQLDEENNLDISEFGYLDHSKVEQEIIQEVDLPTDKDPLFWLPLILSIDYWRSISRSPMQIPSALPRRGGTGFKYDVTRLISNMPVEDRVPDLDFHLHFIQMWKRDRTVDAAYWKVIGQAMYTLEHGDTRGLNGWIDILENAYEGSTKPNYITGKNIRKLCTSVYSSFTDGEIDIRSLAHYAREDSQDRYYAWHDKWVVDALTGSMSGTEAVVGRSFFRYYWLEYMANVNDVRTTFYKFDNHRLTRDQAGISLRMAMSNSFTALYTAMKTNVESQKIALTVNAASCDLAITMIDKIIDRLGRQRYKRDLLGDLAERFRVPGIIGYLDASRDSTLVKNGVLCVSGHNIIFRAGKPQDYLVKSFDAAYRQDYSWSHPRVKEVMRWSSITFVDPDTITFHWKFLSSLLRGGTDKKLVFWSGPLGNNMKTTWQLYLSKICGAKAMSMPINFFTMGKGTANSATPAEIRREGSRLMFAEEPEGKVPFLVGIVKSICGGDKQSGRGLFEEARDIDPQDKVIVVCNNPPPITKEPAVEERVVIIEFGSQARYDAPESEAEQMRLRIFPRDPLFDRKLPLLLDAGLWIMAQTFPLYSREGIANQPKSVIEATKKYWDSIDKYNIFVDDNMIEDVSETIDVFLLYGEFHRWHERRYRREDVPDKDAAVRGFTKRLGDPINAGWSGWSLRKKSAPQQQGQQAQAS